MKKTAAVAPMLFAGILLFASDTRLTGSAGPGRSDLGVPSYEADRDKDGNVDHRIFNDNKGRRVYEEMDYNYDGMMDDFYYYKEGQLDREEIDSDFNGKVDSWIYLYQGKYIKRIEQDKDGDGKPDAITDYDKKK
jgi:hypothetical protein